MARRDFLDEMIAERTKISPEFPRVLDAAIRRRAASAKPRRSATRSATVRIRSRALYYRAETGTRQAAWRRSTSASTTAISAS